ncbi:MAG: orotidine-5'-phosphate decarboxylase [Oscillospiraceae bacterium]|jgi:orotidine-5'-phosphate decarboxylase|nr:orotidine-5'-phosphate decarboxylase [Oscillospiraceae bacterium]
MSFDVLQQKIELFENPTVVGLDPTRELIPRSLLIDAGSSVNAYLKFNRVLIDALCDIVPAVKPQAAYYERLGPVGMQVLQNTCDYALNRGMYVILDAKRGDIGSTATAYAEAYLGADADYAVDAITVNGYLGSDGILPFYDAAKKHDKAIFVLAKTSNPSSGELQDLLVGENRVYELVGDLLEKLGADSVGEYGYSRLGAVVGATYPEELKNLRDRLPHTFFLVPGYGAQGGGAKDVAGAFDENRCGAVINSSRAIIGAWNKTGKQGDDFAEAARAEALRMRDDLRKELRY